MKSLSELIDEHRIAWKDRRNSQDLFERANHHSAVSICHKSADPWWILARFSENKISRNDQLRPNDLGWRNLCRRYLVLLHRQTNPAYAMLSYCIFDLNVWGKGIATSAVSMFLKDIKHCFPFFRWCFHVCQSCGFNCRTSKEWFYSYRNVYWRWCQVNVSSERYLILMYSGCWAK